MVRLYSLLVVLVALSACSAFESHEERRVSSADPAQMIDLTVEPKGSAYYDTPSEAGRYQVDEAKVYHSDVDVDVRSPFVPNPIADQSQDESTVYRSGQPMPRGRMINRSVEVFSLD